MGVNTDEISIENFIESKPILNPGEVSFGLILTGVETEKMISIYLL